MPNLILTSPSTWGSTLAGASEGYTLMTPKKEKSDNAIAYWGVIDIDEEYSRFIQWGATEHSKPTNVGGDIMVATVKDP